MNYQNLNESENTLKNNINSKNNNITLYQKFMFTFINRKFYWKELMKIKTKSIEDTGDISLLSSYVENILYTRLDLENLDLLSDEYIIQLITLLQLIGQYLVYTQKMLESENYELKQNIIYLKNNILETEKYQRIIENLNMQIKEKDFLIKTYQNMTQNGNEINNENNENANEKSNPEISYIKKTYYYCNICLGKKFKSQKYLDEHMIRRHYNFKDLYIDKKEIEAKKAEDEKYRLEFNERINLIKSEYENLFKQKEERQEFDLLNKKFELLQNQIMLQYNNINKEKNKTENEFKIKYDELFIKYNNLLKILEEKEKKEKLDKDFNFDKDSSKNEKNINISKKDSKEEIENKKIEEKNNIIEINQINTNISDFHLLKDTKVNENKNKDEMNKKSDSNILGKKRNGEDTNIIINPKIEKEIYINPDVNNTININNEAKKQDENINKFLTNDGNETMLGKKNISIETNEEKKKSINNNNIKIKLDEQNKIIGELKKSNNTEKDEKKELNISLNSKKDEISIPNNPKILLKNKNENNDINEIVTKNIPSKEDPANIDKLKLFYNQYEQRDKQFLLGDINDYKKTDIPKKSIDDLQEFFKGKEFSENYIKQYKNYDYLNKELHLDDLFNSLKKYKNNDIQNQIISKKSSQNDIKISSNISQENKEQENIINENQNKEENKKSNVVIQNSYIKGFDLTKSMK